MAAKRPDEGLRREALPEQGAFAPDPSPRPLSRKGRGEGAKLADAHTFENVPPSAASFSSSAAGLKSWPNLAWNSLSFASTVFNPTVSA